jgi:HlyD family secretion protein
MKNSFAKVGGVVLVMGAGAGIYLRAAHARQPPAVDQAYVTRGDIVETVASTGTLMPTRTVAIGSQVSGLVQHLYADYNSIVKKGEVLARLDPSVFQTKVDSARATLAEAQIALGEHQAALAVDQDNLQRTDELFTQDLDAETDRDAAVLQVKEDQAQVTQDRSAIAVARAEIEQAQLDVAHCTITSPIDGVVIERDVDEGQAVSARISAPSLFVLGTNLTSLQLVGSVDEADVSKLYPGELATFTVGAYPGQLFRGTVSIVRLNATSDNNVVTYQTVIDAPNPDLRLRPSMTARINVEVWRAADVIRIPEAALKFRPGHEVFAAFGQEPPPPVRLGTLGGAATTDVATGSPSRAQAVRPRSAAVSATAPRIDSLFEPVRPLDVTGQVYVLENGKLSRLAVELGVTDGTWTTLERGNLKPGQQVVTAVTLPAEASAGSRLNPLMPRPFRGGGGFRRGGFGR